MADNDNLHEDLLPRDDIPGGASKFEIRARGWAAQDRIVKYSHVLTEQHDLDPFLVEELEDAYREQDRKAFEMALARFLEALAEAEGLD